MSGVLVRGDVNPRPAELTAATMIRQLVSRAHSIALSGDLGHVDGVAAFDVETSEGKFRVFISEVDE